MKRFLLLLSFLFGVIISAFAIYCMAQATIDIHAIAITLVLVVFAFYPFNFLLLINHKQGISSALEKVLQWPFFGNKDNVPTNLGPWWANRLENAVLLVTFAPFLLIIALVWVIDTIFK